MRGTSNLILIPPVTVTAAFNLLCVIASAAVFAQEKPGSIFIPTVYRDACTITIKGMPDANGTFMMVFQPHGEEGIGFTVNMVKGMKTKKVAYDVAKELTPAAGTRFKVKQNDNEVKVMKANRKSPPLSVEMTTQKFTGMSIMIGK